jgi:hypothetical protein
MHACWILLCMSLNLLSYASLIYKEGINMKRSLRVGLQVASPDLWVVGDVTDWYQSFWLKHRAGMGQVCWSESHGRDQTLTMKLKISGGMDIAEATQETKLHRSSVRV